MGCADGRVVERVEGVDPEIVRSVFVKPLKRFGAGELRIGGVVIKNGRFEACDRPGALIRINRFIDGQAERSATCAVGELMFASADALTEPV